MVSLYRLQAMHHAHEGDVVVVVVLGFYVPPIAKVMKEMGFKRLIKSLFSVVFS